MGDFGRPGTMLLLLRKNEYETMLQTGTDQDAYSISEGDSSIPVPAVWGGAFSIPERGGDGLRVSYLLVRKV